MADSFPIVFMGTPGFAVPSLKELLDLGFDVKAVVTAPDRPAGRGQQVRMSAVKEFALEHDLKVLQPVKLRDPEFITELRALNAEAFFIVAFRMLPEMVWNMPPKGSINLHASLLPNYRGAAPINWVLINGEEKTGATTFQLKHEIDTGDIIDQIELPLSETTTAGELHDNLMIEGAKLLGRTAVALREGALETRPQSFVEDMKKAPKIFKEDMQINWQGSAKTAFDLIRGLSPYPAAWTKLNDKQLKVYHADYHLEAHNETIGSFSSDGKTYLRFYCEDGFVNLLDIQLEGKKRMKIEDFLRGYQV